MWQQEIDGWGFQQLLAEPPNTNAGKTHGFFPCDFSMKKIAGYLKHLGMSLQTWLSKNPPWKMGPGGSFTTIDPMFRFFFRIMEVRGGIFSGYVGTNHA